MPTGGLLDLWRLESAEYGTPMASTGNSDSCDATVVDDITLRPGIAGEGPDGDCPDETGGKACPTTGSPTGSSDLGLLVPDTGPAQMFQ